MSRSEGQGILKKVREIKHFQKSQGNLRLDIEFLTFRMKILPANMARSCLIVIEYYLFFFGIHLFWGTS